MPSKPLLPKPDYEVSCCWSSPDPDGQDAQWCAQKLVGFLHAIQPHCPAGTEWHFLGPKDVLTPLPASADALRLAVLNPGNGDRRGVAPHTRYPQVGFSALFMTASRGGAGLIVSLGQGHDSGGSNLRLTLPSQGEAAQAWSEPARVEALFTTCIRFWQAQGAAVHHTDIRDEDPGHPLPVYWFVYDRAWRGAPLPTMPAGVQIKTLDDGGPYIVTTAERYNRFIDAHRELSDTARATLRQAGLLASGGPFL
ncbi:Imm52 family immunity protein [Aquabacterium sp.]|uniref:Imm52 family immunity protein n=1 Tax=Aquabacterium sp. TaxID=1872578 RepID=UPI00248A1F56|nr:Imm52 family immunity protein [Aquabacterium sp.]MDI1260954.1 hypothetical protein [Aquabacterium sp.]